MRIQNYKRMSRHIFVDVSPTTCVLEGSDVCGIPQGCPFSCVFANVAAYVWVFDTISSCTRTLMTGSVFIGPRVERAFAHDGFNNESVWLARHHSEQKTSVKMVVHKAGIRPACGDHVLRDVRSVKSFKYLGVDVESTSQAPRPTARRRAQDFITKCSFIPLVHFSQRSGFARGRNGWDVAACGHVS